MFKRYCTTAVFIALAAIDPARAADPTGTWFVQDRTAKVQIVACGEALCGTIVWLLQPIDETTGKPQTDKLNADPRLRSRPVIGVSIVFGMKRSGEDNVWVGRVYNPEDGKTYRGSIEFLSEGRLKVKGCISFFCQSEIWTRSN